MLRMATEGADWVAGDVAVDDEVALHRSSRREQRWPWRVPAGAKVANPRRSIGILAG